MEEVCGGGQGLSWAVEPRRETEWNLKGRDHYKNILGGWGLNIFG